MTEILGRERRLPPWLCLVIAAACVVQSVLVAMVLWVLLGIVVLVSGAGLGPL